MGIKVAFSNKYWAKMKRIKNLPKYEIAVVDTKLKYDAYNIKREFSAGIAKNRLGLEVLSPTTIRQKIKSGYNQPTTPLLGKGGNDPRSYKNMLNVRKVKKGWKVYPSRRLHHSMKITLRYLFYIHEYGCFIKRGKSMIRIPSRPAMFLAYQRWLEKKFDIDFVGEIRKAIVLQVNNGANVLFHRMRKQYQDGIARIEKE